LDMFLQLVLSGVMVGSVYGLIALGFVLIFKASGVINLALGELLVWGAFISWTFLDMGLPVWIAIPITLVFCALLGMVIERLALRPMIGQSVFAIVMMTIALSIVLKYSAMLVWGAEQRGLPKVFPIKAINLGDIVLSEQLVWIFFISIAMVILFSLFFSRTKSGLAMRAVAENHKVAQSVGVSVKRVFSISWAICAVIAGLGGFLLASFSSVNFDLAELGLMALPVVLLGGLDSIHGAIIAGIVIGISQNLAGGYIDPYLIEHEILAGGIKGIFPFIIMIIVLMVKPHGLFGQKRIERI